MTSERPDIEADIPDRPKGPVARFFINGWSNIVRMMGANALFILFNIPSIIVAYMYSVSFLPILIPSFDLENLITVTNGSGNEEVAFELFMLMAVFFITFLVSGLLICIGPFQAGFARVYRDIANGTSVSLFDSFKTGIRTGWKKSIAIMLIGDVVTAVCLLAIGFYKNLNSTAGTVIGTVFVILLIAFILIQNFAYVFVVSTDLKLGKIYKNSIIFLFIGFLPCLAVAATVLVFYCIIPFVLLMSASYMTLGIFIFFYAFIVISWVQYFITAYTVKMINKYVAIDE